MKYLKTNKAKWHFVMLRNAGTRTVPVHWQVQTKIQLITYVLYFNSQDEQKFSLQEKNNFSPSSANLRAIRPQRMSYRTYPSSAQPSLCQTASDTRATPASEMEHRAEAEPFSCFLVTRVDTRCTPCRPFCWSGSVC